MKTKKRKITDAELSEILYRHWKFLIGKPGGERANLSNVNLEGLGLRYMHLQGADLSFANLHDANLECALLQDADLHGADLSGANLGAATMWNTDLRGANLVNANLWCTELTGANLRGANLSHSAWPLHCGSLDAVIDRQIFAQLLYHAVRAGLKSKDKDVLAVCRIPEVVAMANQFNRVNDKDEPRRIQ